MFETVSVMAHASCSLGVYVDCLECVFTENFQSINGAMLRLTCVFLIFGLFVIAVKVHLSCHLVSSSDRC